MQKNFAILICSAFVDQTWADCLLREDHWDKLFLPLQEQMIVYPPTHRQYTFRTKRVILPQNLKVAVWVHVKALKVYPRAQASLMTGDRQKGFLGGRGKLCWTNGFCLDTGDKWLDICRDIWLQLADTHYSDFLAPKSHSFLGEYTPVKIHHEKWYKKSTI